MNLSPTLAWKCIKNGILRVRLSKCFNIRIWAFYAMYLIDDINTL